MKTHDYTFDDVLLEIGMEEDILARDYELMKEVQANTPVITVSVFTHGNGYTAQCSSKKEAEEFITSVLGETETWTQASIQHQVAKDNKALFAMLEKGLDRSKLYIFSKGDLTTFDSYADMIASLFILDISQGAITFDGDTVLTFTSHMDLASLILNNTQLKPTE